MNGPLHWRLIVDDKRDAAWNMAFDEATLEYAAGADAATLRFFDWDHPAITIGYAIDAPASLDLDEAERRGVPVIRRTTGGGMVLHGWDLTYAITFPHQAMRPRNEHGDNEGLIETYRTINRAFAAGLERFGVRSDLRAQPGPGGPPAGACFARPTRYDLVVDGKKLIGNAQRRRGQWLLNHGSMPLDMGYRVLLPLLRDEAERAAFAEKSVTLDTLIDALPSRATLIESIAAAFADLLGMAIEPGTATDEELARAEALAAAKYRTRDWNHHAETV
ncbi:MAG: lipoate--protein ligase family protein [Verrucomicrobia bacterium]|nr:lipoate--protein ligase family protein [Verrucomicrobiota bacterium]